MSFNLHNLGSDFPFSHLLTVEKETPRVCAKSFWLSRLLRRIDFIVSAKFKEVVPPMQFYSNNIANALHYCKILLKKVRLCRIKQYTIPLHSYHLAETHYTTRQHLTKRNKQVKPLPVPMIGIGRGFEQRVQHPEVVELSFQKVLKFSQFFRFAGHCILKNAVLSTGCYPSMGQNMGQTVFCKIAEIYFELFDPQNARKSPEILRFQDFLWLRRQDSNLRPPGYEPDELPTALLRDIQVHFSSA